VATLAAGGLLALPAAGFAEVDRNSVTTQAEIVAEAFDGAGETDPVIDDFGRGGFSQFLETVNAKDRNIDSGRLGKADVTQDTSFVEESDMFLGVDSSATADSEYNDPEPTDSDEPTAGGTSTLEVGFDVVNAPVAFTLTGRIEARVEGVTRRQKRRGDSGGSARVTVTDPTGAESVAEIETFESGTDVQNLDLTGTISPGTRTFTVEVETFSGGNVENANSIAHYDLELRFCTQVAGAPGQAVLGTSGDDVLCGRSGNEQLLGAGGSDILFGLAGSDDIAGGDGADMIFGGTGDDARLYGGVGNDDIDAGPGNDGPGAPSVGDVVAGGPGNDELDGGAGNDRLYGRCGEFLLGDPSPVCSDDPPMAGEADDDKLVGRAGADVLLGDAERDVILAGSGDDALVEGFAGPDFIVGGTGDDTLDGGEGNDEIQADAGKDELVGAAGGDCLDGGAGRDDFSGGADNDKLLAKDGGRDTGSGGPAPDRGLFDAADTIASVANRNFRGGC
jgi:Ca2+-binding RTX toxin-like protein